VVGGRRPTILVPFGLDRLDERRDGAASRWTVSSLDALIAHEVAHIRRGDWTTNLAQCVADALLWFHPAARWLSARARREREFACDDLAAAACGGPVRLARALSTLEEARPRFAALAMSAGRGPLLERVSRLLTGAGSPVAADSRVRRALATRAGRWLSCGAASVVVAAALWVTVAVVPVAALASGGPVSTLSPGAPVSTLSARDDAGAFTLSFRGGRAVGATLDGAAVPASRILQTGDSIYFLTPAGEPSFGVRVKPNGAGITWQSRPAPALDSR
jgi:hypothetical protein